MIPALAVAVLALAFGLVRATHLIVRYGLPGCLYLLGVRLISAGDALREANKVYGNSIQANKPWLQEKLNG